MNARLTLPRFRRGTRFRRPFHGLRELDGEFRQGCPSFLMRMFSPRFQIDGVIDGISARRVMRLSVIYLASLLRAKYTFPLPASLCFYLCRCLQSRAAL